MATQGGGVGPGTASRSALPDGFRGELSGAVTSGTRASAAVASAVLLGLLALAVTALVRPQAAGGPLSALVVLAAASAGLTHVLTTRVAPANEPGTRQDLVDRTVER